MYPLAEQNDYTELRYSLRSLKFLTEEIEVVVVGRIIPDWLTGVTQIKYPDRLGQKQVNIKTKVAAALHYAKKVFHIHDDCYLLKPSDPGDYPYYHFGSLRRVGEPGALELRKELEAMGKPTRCFDGHQPLIYDQRFLKSFINFSSTTIVKSAFCNYYEIEGVEIADMKIMKKTDERVVERMIENRSYFSTDISGLGSCLRLLNQLFPNKSKYEIY